MANTFIDVGAAAAAAGKAGSGADVTPQFFTLTATDATATWTLTGLRHTVILGMSSPMKAQDTAPTADDEGNYYIDQDKNASGWWDVAAAKTLAVARVIQATGGTLAADNVSIVLWGY